MSRPLRFDASSPAARVRTHLVIFPDRSIDTIGQVCSDRRLHIDSLRAIIKVNGTIMTVAEAADAGGLSEVRALDGFAWNGEDVDSFSLDR